MPVDCRCIAIKVKSLPGLPSEFLVFLVGHREAVAADQPSIWPTLPSGPKEIEPDPGWTRWLWPARIATYCANPSHPLHPLPTAIPLHPPFHLAPVCASPDQPLPAPLRSLTSASPSRFAPVRLTYHSASSPGVPLNPLYFPIAAPFSIIVRACGPSLRRLFAGALSVRAL